MHNWIYGGTTVKVTGIGDVIVTIQHVDIHPRSYYGINAEKKARQLMIKEGWDISVECVDMARKGVPGYYTKSYVVRAWDNPVLRQKIRRTLQMPTDARLAGMLEDGRLRFIRF